MYPVEPQSDDINIEVMYGCPPPKPKPEPEPKSWFARCWLPITVLLIVGIGLYFIFC